MVKFDGDNSRFVYDRSKQGERKRLTELAKLDEEYRDKTFDIVREVHLPPGQCFVTKFGRRGRHGYIIKDRETGERQIVGRTMLLLIRDRYGAVHIPRRSRIVQTRLDLLQPKAESEKEST